ncbi:leucine-rich repeat flightless-interacting protein 1 isoform X10 [Dromiciops gliroides]|uniref:leucine-rich repeat flightless-interacting protein 1 isoform X10 n=1 Tax=Dromiciops gliroides TaxID=33562 RepID=UPI001CC6CA1D|nr:leucine-rich repeat flightless-interacting protein 1 isoform X10 [Dromiciops gliroides]
MEMGTQGSGRRRLPQRERLTAEDDALSQIAREAEARLAAKRAARAEAREIRMKELERQQKEASDEDERMSVGSRGSLRVEERPEKDFAEKGSRNMPSLSAATLASLGGTSSRRGSGDTSISVDTEASMREIKDSLAEVEEKYKKAMVSNAQLDNEKMNFMYQVDTLKDALLELEEQLAESRRQYEEKNKEFERQKHAHSVLQFQFAEAKEALKQREEMLAKHGIILNSEITTNGEPLDNLSHMSHLGSPKLSQEETNTLKSSSDGTLGRASEVEVASENVDKVGQSAVLQNPEREQPQADSAKAGVDTKALPPDGNAEAETPPQDHAMVPETLAKDPTHVLETHSVPENTNELVEPNGGGDRQGASTESIYHDDLNSNVDQNQETAGSTHFPSVVISQDEDSSLDDQNEKKEFVEKQKEGKSEEEGSRKLAQETDHLGTPDTERIGTEIEELSETHSENLLEGTEAKDRTVVDSKAASKGAKDGAVSGDEKCTDLTKGEQNKEKENGFIKEEPHQTIPSSPQIKSSQPEKIDRKVRTGENECSDRKVPTAERDDQKRQMCDSSPRKSKNKKKKNRKKKSPPVDSPEDVKKELVFQNTEEEEEEEEVKLEAESQAQDALGEAIQEEKPETGTDLDEYVDCPEEAKADLDDGPKREAKNHERGVADDSKASELDNDVGASSKGECSPSEVAGVRSIEESIPSDRPAKKAAEQSQMSKLENKRASGSEPENKEAPSSPDPSPPTEMTEETFEQSDEQPETAEEVLESNSLDSHEATDPEDSIKAESKEDAPGRSSKGKDKNKEECSMS